MYTMHERRALALDCDRCGSPVPLDRPMVVPLRCDSCGQRFAQEAGAVLLGDTEEETEFTADSYRLLEDLEARHYWFAARSRLILAALRRRLGSLEGRRILDVGCGTGLVLAALERCETITCGLDRRLSALQHARARVQGHLIRNQSGRVPFTGQFDVTLACDVIEHVEDDVALLREMLRATRRGGILLVTVPASPRLWSAYDEVAGHRRRYTRRTLVRALAMAGFERICARYFSCLPYPALLLQRRSLPTADGPDERAKLVRDALRVPPAPINALLSFATFVEMPLARICPFGGSLIATAVAPEAAAPRVTS